MSFGEIVILAVIGLVVLGPEELPVMARKAARFLNELRRVKDEILGPITEFHEDAHKLLGQGSDELHKNIVDLMNLRAKLDQEIQTKRAEAFPGAPSISSTPTPVPPAAPIGSGHTEPTVTPPQPEKKTDGSSN